MKDPMRVTEFQTTLPAEYWQTEGAIYGALVDKVSPSGLLILSIRDMPVGTRLNVRILYANEYELDSITVATGIVSKDHNISKDWKGYKYELEFVQISEQDQLKLKVLLNDHSIPEHIPRVQDRIADDSSLRKAVLPPLPDSDLTALPTVNCKSYENGKALKQVPSVTSAKLQTKLLFRKGKAQPRSREAVGPVLSRQCGQIG